MGRDHFQVLVLEKLQNRRWEAGGEEERRRHGVLGGLFFFIFFKIMGATKPGLSTKAVEDAGRRHSIF